MLCHAYHRALAFLCLLITGAATAAPVYVPSELEQWRPWVLQGEEFRRCPYLSSSPTPNANSFRCAWPERLTLTVDAHGGTFTQRWQVSAESWIQLPGDTAYWPADVRVDGADGQVVARNGVPQLRLLRGDHVVSGSFHFGVRPEQLTIDRRTALVTLIVDGKPVEQPERPGGALWLGNRRSADQPQRMQIQVYRLVRDEVPVRLITAIRLRVSGAGREELLAPALPDGFVPLNLESELPARLEADGRMRVQVRPGTWDVTLTSRGATVATQLRRPAVRGVWATEEVWSFAGNDRLRVAAAEGPEGIDPKVASVPDDWQEYPAFRMASDSVLAIVERTRGLANADDNSLQLNRRLWLDFAGEGWTAVDRVSGTLRRDWRLQMAAPFQLESAHDSDDTMLLITRNRNGMGTGVEVRTPDLDLETAARLPVARGALPATGWNTRFLQVQGELNLPPGHRLLAVLGADHAPTTWIAQWGLWALFGVLVVAVAVRWVGGWTAGAVALAGLLLTYQEAPDYIWLWGNAIAAVALVRAAPEGRLRRFATGYRFLSLLGLAVALLPFLFGQVRLALYPQLEPSSPPGVRLGLPADALGNVQKTPLILTAIEAARAPPPAPASSLAKSRNAAASSRELQEIAVTASRGRADEEESGVAQQYAAGTVLQAGPGTPSWRYQVHEYSWSGAVEPGETVRFLYIGPVMLGLWRIAGVVLLVTLFLTLLRPFRGFSGWSRPGTKSPVAAAILMLLLGAAVAPQVRAATTPDAAILEQLKTRLTRSPECAPSCVDITSATVAVEDAQLQVSLAVSALTTLAVPIPSAADHWQLESVSLDGKSALAVGREEDGTTWVPVTPGAHTIRLSGRLASSQAIELAFPLSPHRVSVQSKGWDVTGLNDEQHLISGTLELVDRRASRGAAQALEPSRDFPVFVAVTRAFNFGLNWGVHTQVERIAPEKGALSVEVPLLPGESVLSQKLETRTTSAQTLAVLGLQRGENTTQWASALARSETLELTLPPAVARSEVWSFVVSPQWNVSFEGLPAVLPEQTRGSSWTYEFHPRPGETLKLHIVRPEAAPGPSLAIDSVEQTIVPGRRSSDSMLTFTYRSTQGGRHTIALPQDARVTRVELDDAAVQLRPEHGELSLGLLPGTHSVSVRWTSPNPVGTVSRPAAVDLRAPASNVNTGIRLGNDRWPLFAAGGGVGPAVLYWGQLALFLIAAWLLGRWARSPLRTHEWMLLGVGLSTLSWGVLALVAVWQFGLRWRRNWDGEVPRWWFNLTQVSLALLTLCAVASLIFAGIRQSLLAAPDMAVTGPGSGAGLFSWFVDRSASELPRPVVVSAPLWVYRVLMFAWAFWIATALLRWLRTAWEAWKTNGIWRARPLAATAAPAK